MLHEIFKGMDNAAEAINDNFEQVDIIQGQNENGSYVKFGNGLIVAWFKMTDTHTHATYEWTYPIPFSNPPIVLATPQQVSDLSAYSGVNYGVRARNDSADLRKWNHGGLNYPFSFIAIGYE